MQVRFGPEIDVQTLSPSSGVRTGRRQSIDDICVGG